jgi:hypothetical protein
MKEEEVVVEVVKTFVREDWSVEREVEIVNMIDVSRSISDVVVEDDSLLRNERD